MAEPIQLTCPHAAYQHLTDTVHKTKQGTKTVRVEVSALEALLVDHSRLLRAVPHKEPSE